MIRKEPLHKMVVNNLSVVFKQKMCVHICSIWQKKKKTQTLSHIIGVCDQISDITKETSFKIIKKKLNTKKKKVCLLMYFSSSINLESSAIMRDQTQNILFNILILEVEQKSIFCLKPCSSTSLLLSLPLFWVDEIKKGLYATIFRSFSILECPHHQKRNNKIK